MNVPIDWILYKNQRCLYFFSLSIYLSVDFTLENSQPIELVAGFYNRNGFL